MRSRNSNTRSVFSNSITFYNEMNRQLLLLSDKENQKSSEEDGVRSYRDAFKQSIDFLLASGVSPMQLIGSVGVDRQTRAYFVKQYEALFYQAVYFNRQLELQQAKSSYVKSEEKRIAQLGHQLDRAKLRAKCVRRRVVPLTGVPPIVSFCLFLMVYLLDKYMPDRGRDVNATSDDVKTMEALTEVSAVMCVIAVALTAALYVGCLYRSRQAEAKAYREQGPRQLNLDAFNAAFAEVNIADSLAEMDQATWEQHFNQLIQAEMMLKDASDGTSFVNAAEAPAADVEAQQELEMNEYSSLIANRRG